jgi:hypothetical protein
MSYSNAKSNSKSIGSASGAKEDYKLTDLIEKQSEILQRLASIRSRVGIVSDRIFGSSIDSSAPCEAPSVYRDGAVGLLENHLDMAIEDLNALSAAVSRLERL